MPSMMSPLALPLCLGGLGITNPSADTTAHHDASKKITASLKALIVEQSHQYTNTMKAEQLRIKQESAKDKKHQQSQVAADLKDKLTTKMQRAMNLSSQKGSSSWLSTLPITEHGLHTLPQI